MQFHHPHAFRAQVVEALQAELPDTWDDLLAAGAEPMMAPTGPDGPAELMGIRCRRLVFERVLRGAAAREPGLTLRVGHVDDITADRGHVTGVRECARSREAVARSDLAGWAEYGYCVGDRDGPSPAESWKLTEQRGALSAASFSPGIARAR